MVNKNIYTDTYKNIVYLTTPCISYNKHIGNEQKTSLMDNSDDNINDIMIKMIVFCHYYNTKNDYVIKISS